MADTPKTKPDSPPADQTADIAQSEAYETANVVSATETGTAPSFGPRKSPDEIGTLGPYRVVRELGRGGMGAVYLGFDERLKRKVALKVMLPKYAAVASSKNRFLREARAAAGITHDHIVTIYEADEYDGTPLMAMQLLQGYPLDVYLKKHPRLSLGELLRIGREMALGLAAAHSVGLIHRDIKPGNIWLEAPNGRVKILDFGLAKPTEDQKVEGELTATGVIVGTPAYMPPEQARGAKADFRADLFSLGVVLYRLATGTMPFHGDTMMAMLAAVIADDPPPVRELNPDIPEPLAKLIHELLEKKPQNRPKSADEVAERLQQIQLGTAAAISLPMQVIPLDALPTTTYAAPVPQADPFAELDTEPNEVVTRHNTTRSLPALPAAAKKPLPKWPLIALGLFLLVVAALIPQIISIMTPKGTLVIESTDPDVEITVKQGGATIVDKSKGREFVLRVGDNYTIDMVEKDGLKLNVNKFEITRNNKSTVRVVVQRPPPKPKVEPPPSAIQSAAPIVPLAWQGPSPLDALDAAAIPAAEKFDWQPKELVGVYGSHAARHWGSGSGLAVSPDGQTIATGGTDNTIRLWDATTLQPRGEIAGLNAVARRFTFSKDGRLLLTLATVDSVPEFVLCDLAKKAVVERLAPKVKEPQLAGIPFIAPDGRLLAASHEAPKYDGTVRVIDLKTGALVVELKGHPATGYIWTALSPDGSRFATLHSGHVQLWDAKTGQRLYSWNEMKPGGDNWLAFSPDGKWIAASSGGSNPEIDLHVWDTATGKSVLRKNDVTKYYAMTVAFSRDFKQVVIGGTGGGLSVVDVPSGNIAVSIATPKSPSFHEAVFNADGSRVVTFGTHYGVGGDGILHSYDAKTGAPIGPGIDRVAGLESVAFAPDLKSLFTHDATQHLRVWNTVTGQSGKPIELTPHGVYSTRKVLPFPDGKRAVVLEKSTTIRDLATGEVLQDLNTKLAMTADLSTDGKRLAIGSRDEKLELWNFATTPATRIDSVSTESHASGTVRFSPDGLRLATEGHDKAAVWDVANGVPKKLFEIETTGTPYAVAWAPDGKSLAYVQGANLSFWSIDAKAARKKSHEVQTDGEYFANQVLAYHPTGKWVAVIGQKTGKVFLYNPADGTLAKSWTFPAPPTDLQFAADGRHLAIANPNGTVYVLRLESAAAALQPIVPLAWKGPSPLDALDAAALPKGLEFDWTTNGLVGVFGSHESRHWGGGMCLAVSPDGKTIATGGTDKLIRIWNSDTLKPSQKPLAGHTRPIIALQFSPDGQKLLSTGDTGEMKIRLWDVRSGQLLDTMEMLIDGRASTGLPFFGRNGQPFVAVMNANDAGRVIIYDLSAKSILHELPGHEPKGMCITAISRDGTKLATNDGKAVRLWNAGDGKLLHEWKGFQQGDNNGTYQVQFSPDGMLIAASIKSNGNELHIWDTMTGKTVLHRKNAYKHYISSLAFSSDGKRICAGGGNNGYAVFEVPTGKELCQIEQVTPVGDYDHGEAVFNATGSRVVTFGCFWLNSRDGILRSYDAKTGQPAIPLPTGPVGPITSLAMSGDLTQLFTIGADQTLRVWDSRTQRLTAGFETTKKYDAIPKLALLPDGKRLIVIEKLIAIRDRATGNLLESMNIENVSSLTVSEDGRIAIVGTPKGTIEAFDVSATPAKPLWSYSVHDAAVHSIAISPDAKRLSTCANDHRAFVWDITGTAPKKLFELGNGGINAGEQNTYQVVWLLDGQRVAVARGSGVVVWDVGGKLAMPRPALMRPKMGMARITIIAQHPWLPWLVAADSDGRVTLWNTADGTIVKTWSFPVSPTALHFAADGRHLLTANPNGTVSVLRLDVPKPPADPDRAAAEWALGRGAEVVCDIGARSIPVKAIAELPKEPFTVDRVDFARGTALADADIANLEGLKRLRVVIASGTPLGNAGAERLSRIESLTDLHLADTMLGDTGLMALAKLRQLRLLTVAGTAISGSVNTLFGDKAVLEDVNLHNTAAGDETVRALAKCPKLATLHLSGTKVTDAGLAALESRSSLRLLTLAKAPVTEAGVKKLAAALPLCKIEWDGGTIEPRRTVNVPPSTLTPKQLKSLNWTIKVGGRLTLMKDGKELRLGPNLPGGTQLPSEPFEVLSVYFSGAEAPSLSDADLANLDDLPPALKEFVLVRTPISNQGLGSISRQSWFTSVRRIHFYGNPMTAAGLSALLNAKDLSDLVLIHMPLKDSDTVVLRQLRLKRLALEKNETLTGSFLKPDGRWDELTELSINMNSMLRDSELAHLKHYPKLQILNLKQCPITDRAITAIAECKGLTEVTLTKTQVTAAGVKVLAAKLPLCKIEWDGGTIEPSATSKSGLAFDGESTYVRIPTALGGSNFPLTIEAWITPQSVTGKSRHIFLFGKPGGGMGLSENGNLGVGFKTPKEWVNDYGRSSLKPGERVHVAAVATANQLELFLNGRSDGIKVVQIGSLIGIDPPALIGKQTRDAPEGYFHGTMHALRVSKSVRYTKPFAPENAWKPDADTIAQYHFDEGQGAKLTDHSGNGHHGVIVNGTWVK